jgi:ABC-2 type transport system permease protein
VNLALLHGRYLVLENLRVPIAVVSTALFPALSLLFFVVPFDWARTDPVAATTAIAQLTVFAVMSALLFTFGVGVADDRENSWDPYLRTLPVPVWPRIAGRLLNGAVFTLLGVLPVVVVGALTTAAAATPLQLAGGLVALLAAGLPFLLGGLAIGYSLPVKAAQPVTQVVFFPIAFGGGLLLPPTLFPDWLQAASTLLPSRGARDLVVWAAVGTPPDAVALVALAAWTLAAALLAGWAHRRDEGRRFT